MKTNWTGKAMNEFTDGDQESPVAQNAPLLRRWLEGGQAILDSEHRIVAVNAALASWLEMEIHQCQALRLEDLLVERHPEWVETLTNGLAPGGEFSRLTLASVSGIHRNWYCLEIARHAGTIFVRLESILPPQKELAEAGWDEYLQSEPGHRNLFVRLLRVEALLENLVQRWPGVIFSQRADFSFQFVNSRIEELTGVALAEWRRQPQRFWQVVHESDVEELRQQLKRVLQSPQGSTMTYRIRHAQTGRIAYVLEHRHAVKSDSGLLLGYEGVWLDVTRQTIAEKRLSSAAWKETLAVLTMGLAHDFSNIMAGIHSLSESFLSQVGKDHAFHEGLALIKHHSLQASQLVHRIINLHHGKTGERNYHNLNEIVSDLVDLVQKILPRRVQVATMLAPDALPLYVDAVEFRQVIINLTLNAADAMPQGGQLQIQTTVHDNFPPVGHLEGSWPRLPAICLSVKDNGFGVSPRHLAAIFDPFFTTKAMNKGSGLGLYNARLFVEKHQGAISVDSTEGRGTCFQIWLPQADFTEAERAVVASASRRYTLLLVGAAGKLLDDTAEFLRMNGYHTVVASDCAKATNSLRGEDYPFVGVLLLHEPHDPQFTPLLAEARRQRPPLKTVIQIVGGHPDELDTQITRLSDLIIAPDLSSEEVLAKLKATIDASSYPGRQV
jgi:PAS domain S-box-containing protein